jgi:hypothetical protein
MPRTIDVFLYRTSPGSIRPVSMVVGGEGTVWLRIKRLEMWRWPALFIVEGTDALRYSLISYLIFRSSPIRIYGYCDWIAVIFPLLGAAPQCHSASLNVFGIDRPFQPELCRDSRLFPRTFRVSGMLSPYSPFHNFFSFNLETSVYLRQLFFFSRYIIFLVCFPWLLFAESAFCRTRNFAVMCSTKQYRDIFLCYISWKFHTTLPLKEM